MHGRTACAVLEVGSLPTVSRDAYRYPTQYLLKMAQFATTADIRSVDDSSTLGYTLRYATFFATAIAIDLMLRALKVSSADPIVLAVMVAYLCTRPTTNPRFRSLPRFVIAVVLSVVLSGFSWLFHCFIGIGNASAFKYVFTAVFFTVIFGCIESLSFWCICVVTPGRSPD